jgi:uncharacterized protein (TIGR02246 family)
MNSERGVEMVRADIEAANAQFSKAFGRRDAAAIAAFYTEDATVLPPNGQMIKGSTAIQEFWKGVMGMGVRGVRLNTIPVESSGDLAYEIGNATLDIEPEGGKASTDSAKYVVVWKRQADQSWKLAADIWNSVS